MRLVPLPPEAMRALAEGDTETASTLVGVPLGDYLAGAEVAWLWRMRLEQIAVDPECEHWVAGAVVSEPDGTVVGHAGFHGPPGPTGTVEVGYAVDPAYRRRGYAKAMLAELLRKAASDPRVRKVRASVSPDNAASLATVAAFGFEEVGEAWDEDDGLEKVFELPLRSRADLDLPDPADLG